MDCREGLTKIEDKNGLDDLRLSGTFRTAADGSVMFLNLLITPSSPISYPDTHAAYQSILHRHSNAVTEKG